MPQVKIPLTGHIFKLTAQFSKVATANPKSVEAIIDTGASITCVSFSTVQQLGISPAGPFSLTNTASGLGFSRPYPIEIDLDGKIKKLTSCSVLFQPAPFMQVVWKNQLLTGQELQTIVSANGRPMPEAVVQRSTKQPDGTYLVMVFQPGPGVEQPLALIGMNFLAEYHWSFSKTAQELAIEY